MAALVAAAIAPMGADAKPLTVEPSVSLPYVEDVNPSGSGYIATVTCCGAKGAQLKVTSKGKRVKVRKHAPRVWTVKMRKAQTYKLSVRAKGGSWKSIAYRIY